MHFFSTQDGVQLKLTRYQAGNKGPVILWHRLGVSSTIFSIDPIDLDSPGQVLLRKALVLLPLWDNLGAYRWHYILSGTRYHRFTALINTLTAEAQRQRLNDALRAIS